MRLPILQHTSERLLRNVAIVLIAGFGAGCSADTMRFTDGIFTGSTSSQPVAQQPAGNVYASAPVASAPPVSSGTVQRNSLPPVSSAPLGAPVAAASTQMRNQVDQAQDMAASRVNNTVNAAETRVASAATVTHNTVNGAKEKVLASFRRRGRARRARWTTISLAFRKHLLSTARNPRRPIWHRLAALSQPRHQWAVPTS